MPADTPVQQRTPGNKIVQGMQEALAVAKGEAAPAAVHVRQTTPARCLTCWWWGLRDSGSDPACNRICHRFPPIATRNAEGEMENEWPWTNQNDYCGEHRPYE